MITAALNGDLDHVKLTQHETFKLMMPETCPNVPDDILDPSKTWNNQEEYKIKAEELSKAFLNNFKQFENVNIANLAEEELKMC
jgi:phosphoenolpyruvate carboxykinase (ATP)